MALIYSRLAFYHCRIVEPDSACQRGSGQQRRRTLRRRCVLELLEPRLALSGSPTQYTVNSTGNSPTSGSGTSGTLPYVISQANTNTNPAGSEIVFEATVFSSRQTITLGATLELSETSGPEVIAGPGAALVTISGGDEVSVFTIEKSVTAMISGVTISGGSTGGSGGGVYNQGTATLSECTISQNDAGTDLPTFGGGGGVYNLGTATFSDCTISDNTANSSNGAGGGVFNNGTAVLTDCEIIGNSAVQGDGGGGLFNEGMLNLSGCTISGNTGGNGGGGVWNYAPGNATLSDCTISGNSAEGGGGLLNFNVGAPEPTLTLANCTISDNSASENAGGMSIDGHATVKDCEFTGNVAGTTGGAVSFGASGTGSTGAFSECSFKDNSAGGSGGGISVGGGSLTIELSSFSGNSSSNQGGAIAVFGGSLTATGDTISGNTAVDGGGLFNGATCSATNCTIANNTASDGGGLDNEQTTALTACTISGNSASAYGGGIYNTNGSNSSARTVTLTDTIVAGNNGTHGPDDINGNHDNLVTGSYNLIGTGGSGGTTNGVDHNIVLTNLGELHLGPLAANGGPTETMALLPGSAAIHAGSTADNAGTTSPITTDQRGSPLDSPPDIGAYQTQIGPLSVVSIAPVTPTPRNTPVSSVNVTLNEPARAGGFTASALTLTDNGGPNLIDGGVTMTLVSGSTYLINGLSTITTAEGSYKLTVNAADIEDQSGNAGTGSLSTSWLMDITPPTSAINPLPSQTTSTSFIVSVTASEPSGASPGIASIAIYDSVNGGAFTLFATVTPAHPSAAFTGQIGDTYGFYSIATDNLGNVQTTPSGRRSAPR